MDAIDRDINLSFAVARMKLRKARRSHLMAAVQEPLQSVSGADSGRTETKSDLSDFFLPEHFELVDGEQTSPGK